MRRKWRTTRKSPSHCDLNHPPIVQVCSGWSEGWSDEGSVPQPETSFSSTQGSFHLGTNYGTGSGPPPSQFRWPCPPVPGSPAHLTQVAWSSHPPSSWLDDDQIISSTRQRVRRSALMSCSWLQNLDPIMWSASCDSRWPQSQFGMGGGRGKGMGRKWLSEQEAGSTWLPTPLPPTSPLSCHTCFLPH